MIIHTNENNTSSLKLIIASKIAKNSVEVRLTSVSDPNVTAPHILPVLEVNEDLKFFSSNAALLYLLPNSKSIDGLVIKELLEWEATRLLPIIIAVLSSKSVAPDVKQTFMSYLSDLDKRLTTEHYLLASELSAADISIWCSLFPLLSQSSFKDYTSGLNKLTNWFSRVQGLPSVQESIRSWSKGNNDDYLKGSAILASSKLGLPLSTLAVAGSPDEAAVNGPTAEEISLAEDRWLNGHKILPKLPPKQKVVLPQKGFKNILITSALPYVNNIPHLGNIIGCVLSADIFARYCRMCGYNTLYICGTDEYGTATETKALEEGLNPRQICDKYFEIHNAVYRWFGIGFDYFGRTTTPEQTEIVQKMFLKLKDNGFMNTESVEQLLCAKCDRFLADRFVEGTCPHPGCGYEDARGDQCDACGRLVTATDLIKPRCKICSSTPQVTQSRQFFLDLPQLEGALRSWFTQAESGWSGTSRAVTKAWLRDGLRPRCITRDLKWGIPVPIEEFKSKVFYVWFDAPIGYMSITQKYTNDYEKWWKPDAKHEVKLYQFMAKDNVPFHGIMFPATLIGVNEKHILVNHIMATEYLNYEEGKFSKSRGVGVFGTDAQETGIPADVWRFYLTSIRPEGQDSSFSWNELVTRNNSELLNNLGNFCHRGLSFCASSFKGIVPELNLNATDLELIALINREIKSYVKGMEAGRLRDALRHVLTVSRLGNQYMQSEQPWVLLKGSDQDKLRAGNAVAMCCNVSALLATLLSPFMPETSRRLFQQIATTEEHCRVDPEHPEMRILLPSGHRIGKPEPLFEKLDVNTIEQLKAKYAGTQDQRAQKKGSSESQINTDTSLLTVAELEEAVAKQGEKVRALKQSGIEKAVWQPEVNILLDLKKKLVSALKTPPTLSNSVQTTANSTVNTGDVKQLEEEISKQGEKVRALKQSGVEKAVWQPEVNILLDLKKKLASAPKTQQVSSNSVQTTASNTGDVKQLEEEIAKQGEKVRSLKTSGAEKGVWQPEVNLLLELKKKLVLAGGEVAAPPKPGKQKKK